MRSSQVEESVPAPPPYAAEAAPVHTQSVPATYAPPPGPPPTHTEATSETYLAAPPLAQAPPTYEPFSFADEYHRTQNFASHSKAPIPPGWHAPPVYHIYHDAHTITFHIATASTEPPCACGTDFVCSCGRRRPQIWQSSRVPGSSSTIQLRRISPFSGQAQVAMTVTRGGTMFRGANGEFIVKDSHGRKVTRLAPSRGAKQWTMSLLDSIPATWTRQESRLELKNATGHPMAILQAGSTPARLELTAFPWARMPSDQIECDYDGCILLPLYGFVFRCIDCTEQGQESFDVCEPHLEQVCASHDPSHKFVRQPRPFAPFDDAVRETPLLRQKDMLLQRKSQETVLATLSAILLA